jgi:hypothetical protein
VPPSHGGYDAQAMVERTELERIAAMESMYRFRAVESPPDAQGRRTIWHRGAKGAELVSDIDAEGRVVRHELTLFDDRLRWERETGFQAVAGEEEGHVATAASASRGVPPGGDPTAPVLNAC